MTSDSDDGRNWKSRLNRRNYLQLTGALLGGSVLGASQIGRAQGATHHGIEFDRVVDAVDDLGCDPNGNEDVSSKVGSALDGKTLVEFPSGTYHWEGSVTADTDRVGLRGKSDDVLFTFPSGYNEFFVNTSCDQALFTNFDVDVRPDQTATGIRVASKHGFHIENIEHIGRAIVDSGEVTRCWQLQVEDPNSTGVIKNFVAKKGSGWAHYKAGDGRVGISVYGGKGTIKVIDCHLEEFGNNGIYASRSLSAVQVIGGTFRNNNVASVRVSGKGSYVDGATIEIDPEKYSGPRTLEDDQFKLRAVIFEQGNEDTGGFDEAGGEIRNTEITVQENPTTGPAVSVWTGGRTLSMKNTKIVYNNNGAPAIYRESKQSQGKHDPAPAPRWLRMDRVEILGSASDGPTVRIAHGSGSQITNSYIEQSGDNRSGVVFENSQDTLVKDTTIKVPGKAVRMKSASGKTTNVSSSGSPLSLDVGEPSPNSSSQKKTKSAASKDEDDSKSNKSNESDDSDDSDDSNKHSLEIVGGKSKANYTLAVDGTVKPDEDLGSFECSDSTFVGKNWASGTVKKGSTDAYKYTGSVTSLSIDDGATVRIDGEEVDPKTLGGDPQKQHNLIIDGSSSSGPSKYTLSVDGSLEKGAMAECSEVMVGSTARGTVYDDQDNFHFTGQITRFDVDGDATITFGED